MAVYNINVDKDGTTTGKEEIKSAESYPIRLAKAAEKKAKEDAEKKAKQDAAARKKSQKGQAAPTPAPALGRWEQEGAPPPPTEPPMTVWKKAVMAALDKDPRYTA